MVFATGSLGEIGIAPGHTPLLTGLSPGPVRVQNGDDEKTFFCSGGFIEIQPDLVTFLSDRAERAESMDEAEEIKAQELAEKNMHDKESELDYTKAAAQLAEAAARIVINASKSYKLGRNVGPLQLHKSREVRL